MIDVTEIDGRHTGENLASYFFEIINSYGIAPKLFCITADNASSNRTMARALQDKRSSYKSDQHLLRCVGHVVNLAAKAGLKAMGPIVPAENPKLVLLEDEVGYLIKNFSSVLLKLLSHIYFAGR